MLLFSILSMCLVHLAQGAAESSAERLARRFQREKRSAASRDMTMFDRMMEEERNAGGAERRKEQQKFQELTNRVLNSVPQTSVDPNGPPPDQIETGAEKGRVKAITDECEERIKKKIKELEARSLGRNERWKQRALQLKNDPSKEEQWRALVKQEKWQDLVKKVREEEMKKWCEGDLGFSNSLQKEFEVIEVDNDNETLTVTVNLEIKTNDAVHLEVQSGAAGHFQKVWRNSNKVFLDIRKMFRQELENRMKRSKVWDEKMRDYRLECVRTGFKKVGKSVIKIPDIKAYGELKEKCDFDELETLPKDIFDIWEVIVESRKHKKNFEEASKKVPGLETWTSLAAEMGEKPEQGQYNAQKREDPLLNPALKKANKEDFVGLYKRCGELNEEFQRHIETLAEKMRGSEIKFTLHTARPKDKVRGLYKFIYKYEFDARRLTDVLRTTFVFENLDDIKKAAANIHEFFQNPKFGGKGIENIKDRIRNPPSSGYRDILLNVRFHDIYVEIQLHLKVFKDLKKDMHANYKKARHFGKEFAAICFPTDPSK